MENSCIFSKDHKCILRLEYEITRQELEECHTLCHGNWIEIERKYKYIQELRHLLDEHGIPYPEEYEIDYIIFKGLVLCQTLFHTLKLAPHERPSTQPLTKNPQQLCYFLCQTLTKDPQQVWQTLKNFDYPIKSSGKQHNKVARISTPL